LNVNLLRREQYQLASLVSRRIALCSEANASDNLVEDALIKALVASDCMKVRMIYREPFDLIPVVKLWWSMNRLPAVADTSEGFWRRVRVIPFNRSFGTNDKIIDLKERLLEEMPGIFNWALQGLYRLLNDGEFTLPQQVREATEKYQIESNIVQMYITEKCEVSDIFEEMSSDLYDGYRSWCVLNGFKAYSIKTFKRELEDLRFFSVRRTKGVVVLRLKIK